MEDGLTDGFRCIANPKNKRRGGCRLETQNKKCELIIIITLYLYSTFHTTRAAQSALQNDTSQVQNKQEIPLKLFVNNFKRHMQQHITCYQVNRHKEVLLIIKCSDNKKIKKT